MESGSPRFTFDHRTGPLEGVPDPAVAALLAWRQLLHALGLVGHAAERFDGRPYGVLSVRLGPESTGMLMTASLTGGAPVLGRGELCVVDQVDLPCASARSRGPWPPSPSCLMHAAVYAVAPAVGAVLHVRNQPLHRHGVALGLASTRDDVPAGTQAMALEVERWWREGASGGRGVLVVGAEAGGVVAVGGELADAGARLVRELGLALTRERLATDFGG